jgi:hypothetical protein
MKIFLTQHFAVHPCSPVTYAEIGSNLYRKRVELDLWIPREKLAFELQGVHHYHNTQSYFRRKGDTQFRLDQLKKKACSDANIQLVTVPYWWDETRHSLAYLIHESS